MSEMTAIFWTTKRKLETLHSFQRDPYRFTKEVRVQIPGTFRVLNQNALPMVVQ